MEITDVTRAGRKLLKRKYCGAVIVAAGSAARMGGEDKILAELGGKPVLLHSVEALAACGAVDEIVVVTRPERIIAVMDLCAPIAKVKAVVAGGKTRQESVQCGLNALSGKVKIAAIHDGARPLVTWQLADRVVRAANTYGAAVPAVPVKDTVKVARGGIVAATPDRNTLVAAQTPQAFDFDLLRGAMRRAAEEGLEGTDEAALVERLGFSVKVVLGDERNLKITTPMDLQIAKMLLEASI